VVHGPRFIILGIESMILKRVNYQVHLRYKYSVSLAQDAVTNFLLNSKPSILV
jgi:hypothetical protein